MSEDRIRRGLGDHYHLHNAGGSGGGGGDGGDDDGGDGGDCGDGGGGGEEGVVNKKVPPVRCVAKLGRAVQVDSIKTRVESAFGFSA